MTAAQMALVAMLVLPAAVGGILAPARRAERVAAPAAVAASILVVVLAAVVAVERPALSIPFIAGADLIIEVSPLAGLVAPMVAAVTVLVLVFSTGHMRASRPRFHGLMLLFAASALLTVTAGSLPILLFAWELMGATSYALIGFWWRDQYRVTAGLTAFITTRTADLGLYLAAGAALAGGAGMALDDLAAADGPWRDVIAAGILVAALGKAAQLPFSFWLSGAMSGPSPVSALLHSAAMVAMGGYLLLRVEPLLAATAWAGPTAAWIGVTSAVLLGCVALAQRELKQLLAASTIAQLGFVVMAAGVGAVSGGAAHLVAHAATKALLFLVAGVWLAMLGTEDLGRLRGVARRWPLVGATATVGALALAGIAPLSLWATKDAVLAGALAVSAWLYAAGLVATALSAAYAGKALWVIWRRDGPAPTRAARSVGVWQQAPLVVLAAAAAALGALALPPLARPLAQALGGSGAVSVLELVISAVLALVALLVVARWRVPAPRWAREWLHLEPAITAFVVRPVMGLAHALARFDDRVLDAGVVAAAKRVDVVGVSAARFDDRVLDAGVVATARTVDVVGESAAAIDDDRVDGVVEALATGVRSLGRLARRPQTGAVHQYLLQAVAVVTLAVVVFSVYALGG